MTESFCKIDVTMERRLCIVEGRAGYFIGFEQYSDVIEPSLLKGGHPGGQYSRTYGLVEFPTDNRESIYTHVERVSPVCIKFIDREAVDILSSIQEKVGVQDEKR